MAGDATLSGSFILDIPIPWAMPTAIEFIPFGDYFNTHPKS